MTDYTKEITILYVEDEDDVRDGYARALTRICHKLYLASNGLEGLDLYKEYKPNIVVSDIRMPKMDGLEMVKRIKEIDPDVDIVFTTAHSESSYLLEAIELQVEGYLLKPVQKNAMVSLIKKLSKNITLEKENIEQRKVLQYIIDSENSLSIITNGKSVSFASKSFLNLFGVQDVKELNKKFISTLNIFSETDGSLSKINIEESLKDGNSFYETVKNISAIDRIITIKNIDENIKSFYLNISKTSDINYLINLTDITKIEEEREEVQKKVYTDTLTGVFNRNKFEEVFEYEIKQSRRYHTPFSMAILDIDHFKIFNDKYGHLIGDEVLIMLSQAMKNSIREADMFARWGGEEFVVLFNNTTLKNAVISANKFKNIIGNLEHKTAEKITASFGLTQFQENDTIKTMFERADKALYKAKNNGRNRIEFEE